MKQNNGNIYFIPLQMCGWSYTLTADGSVLQKLESAKSKENCSTFIMGLATQHRQSINRNSRALTQTTEIYRSAPSILDPPMDLGGKWSLFIVQYAIASSANRRTVDFRV